MKIVAIIPARMASSRFPGKPLAPILGLPMIEHVRRRALLCDRLDDAVVATCDTAIQQVVERAGGTAIMTSEAHERCTDRIGEAAVGIGADIVVNIQGDEPLIDPRMIDELVEPLLRDDTLVCTNLMLPITDAAEFADRNVVKTVVNRLGDVLYFSREPIPSNTRGAGDQPDRWKQLGIVAFRRDFLQTFVQLPPTPLEKAESVDMMRAVEHGFRVRMVPASGAALGVDVPGDIARAEDLLARDPFVARYLTVR